MYKKIFFTALTLVVSIILIELCFYLLTIASTIFNIIGFIMLIVVTIFMIKTYIKIYEKNEKSI